LLFAYATVGTIELMKGDIDRAVVALERGRRLLGDTALPFHVSIVGAPTARAYAAAGRIAEAIALGEEAIEQAVRIGLMAGQARRLTWLGEVYLAARRREDAARAGERALTLAREQGARGDEAWSHALLGELGARGDDQSAAHDRSAVALARDLGMDALLTRRRRRLEAR
jgi:tetratricopeptide (TPR) repeat protein